MPFFFPTSIPATLLTHRKAFPLRGIHRPFPCPTSASGSPQDGFFSSDLNWPPPRLFWPPSLGWFKCCYELCYAQIHSLKSYHPYLRPWLYLETGSLSLKWALIQYVRCGVRRKRCENTGRTLWEYEDIVCKLREEALNRSFPHSPQKEPIPRTSRFWTASL